MGTTFRAPKGLMTLRHYRILWYVCTSLGLVSAVFLAPLHWMFLVSTIVIAWGGPLLIEFGWDIAIRNMGNKTSAEINTEPIGETNDVKQRKRRWFTDEHLFNSGTCTMWFATLIALLEPENSILFLVLGISFPLTLYGIRGVMKVLVHPAR